MRTESHDTAPILRKMEEARRAWDEKVRLREAARLRGRALERQAQEQEWEQQRAREFARGPARAQVAGVAQQALALDGKRPSPSSIARLMPNPWLSALGRVLPRAMTADLDEHYADIKRFARQMIADKVPYWRVQLYVQWHSFLHFACKIGKGFAWFVGGAIGVKKLAEMMWGK